MRRGCGGGDVIAADAAMCIQIAYSGTNEGDRLTLGPVRGCGTGRQFRERVVGRRIRALAWWGRMRDVGVRGV